MKKLLVCIPTLTGREEYLSNAIDGYLLNSPDVDLKISLEYDAPTCGIGWQRCVDKMVGRTADRFSRYMPDYIHFGNDDIVVGEGWLAPLIEGVDRGCLPVSRMEPAGYHIGDPMPWPPPMPPAGDPTSGHGYFYSDLPENQPKLDWEAVNHGGLPFCSLEQWKKIGPFIPIHFGTDKWFYHIGSWRCGYSIVVRQKSVIYNYAAAHGRNKGDWGEVDFLDFDLTVAYPMYLSGELQVDEPHPLRRTPEGLQMVREWRAATFPLAPAVEV